MSGLGGPRSVTSGCGTSRTDELVELLVIVRLGVWTFWYTLPLRVVVPKMGRISSSSLAARVGDAGMGETVRDFASLAFVEERDSGGIDDRAVLIPGGKGGSGGSGGKVWMSWPAGLGSSSFSRFVMLMTSSAKLFVAACTSVYFSGSNVSGSV